MRQNEFGRLLNGENLDACPAKKSRKIETKNNFNEQVNADEEEKTKIYDDILNVVAAVGVTTTSTYEDEFISAGLWITTVIFLALSSIFALLSAFFSMINILCNPIQMLMSTFGLYIWNGLAAILCSLTMIIWSSQFAIFISKNIAITSTLRTTAHYSSNGFAQLGFSYWILIVSIFCHLINVGLVYYRNYLLEREPKPSVINVSKNDSTIFVY
jgi:hypothetical protein